MADKYKNPWEEKGNTFGDKELFKDLTTYWQNRNKSLILKHFVYLFSRIRKIFALSQSVAKTPATREFCKSNVSG